MTQSSSKYRIEAIDLFCGAGGLTCGLKKTGSIDVLCGVDNDPKCEFPYTFNNQCHFILKSIEKTIAEELTPFFSKNSIKLLAGCAPCQTFSRYNPRATEEDTRWGLLLEFGRIVRGIMPDYVTMENVPGLAKHDIFQTFIKMLRRYKYKIWYDIIDCSKYGLPQQRHRLVLLASRFGDISLLAPEDVNAKSMTVRDAIGGLEKIGAGAVCESDALHRSRNLSPLNLKRVRYSVPGGSWRDWPKRLVLKCHKNQSGKTYSSVYGRMRWSAPSPTITTQFFGLGNGRFGHPEQDRALSLREGAILQGFPNDYLFVSPSEPISFQSIGKLVGNAVPVRLGEVIGMSILQHLKSFKTSSGRTNNG